MLIATADLERQARWEAECFRRAAEKFRQITAGKAAHEVPGAQKVLGKLLPDFQAALAADQKNAVTAVAAGTRPSPWMTPIQLLSAETLAVTTAVTAFNGVLRGADRGLVGADHEGCSLVILAKMVAAAVQQQAAYDKWRAGDKAAEQRFRKRHPDMGRTAWQRWSKRIGLEKPEAWTIPTQVFFGVHLLTRLTEAAPTLVEIGLLHLPGGQSRKQFRATPKLVELLETAAMRREIAIPLYRPMKCPPIPWRYEEPVGIPQITGEAA